ncbi:RNA-directed DNA polymerase (Reverse transcriptase) [Dactylosporangium sp. NBC_01737]|uniref:RNA-directed DNA polymerase (Reverse transcriptase) n=1 Tax=Dactylosporangium sp. NBC_01737 TaxID=2975959 RepID=UPI002E15E466|nr:RNA-directed DNA polymerase (Reverse transcriptase) [Dactylosporangium sp. NBC_01737]
MPYLLDMPHLVTAARLCMRRAGAPGADGLTWAGYRQGLRDRLTDLAQRLRNGVWQPGPLRIVEITSYAGKVFEAAIPTVEDRIVHRAMRRAVEPILENRVLADWVSAYRPRRNRITALRQADAYLTSGLQWVADVDVAGASTGGATEQFVDWLAVHVADGTFLRLFGRAVAVLPTPLIPGSGLWPTLFHLRLSQVDALLNGWPIVRFADNYLIFTADQSTAVAAFDAITAALATVQLRPHPRKSRVRPPHQANTEDLFLIDG